MNKQSLTLTVGGNEQLQATVSSKGATEPVFWSSNHDEIASVSSTGLVTAKSAGSAIIKCHTEDESISAQCTVQVNNPVVNVTGVTLNKDTLTLSLAGTTSETLTATIVPQNATNKTVSWDSSDDIKVTVTNGTVTAIAVTDEDTPVIITVTTQDGSYTDTCSVTVTE